MNSKQPVTDGSQASQPQAIKTFLEAMPATGFLGIGVIELADGRSTLELPIRPELTFDGAIVQGGIVGVLADYAAVSAAGSTLPAGWRVATLGCETHNVAAAEGQRLVAIGEVIKRGTRHLVSKASVHIDDSGGPICLTGLFTSTGIKPVVEAGPKR